MSQSVGEDFPEQQARARELLKVYRELGPVGSFGALMIESALRRADKAAISGDIVKILAAYEELRGLE